MIRTLIYLFILIGIGAAFAWFANYNSDIVVMMHGQRIVMSVFHAGCALLGAIIVLLMAWWFVKSIIMAPFVFNSHLKNRQRDRGYQALSQGLIAVMSGDITNARKMLTQSNKLIDKNKEPLILLLDAQTKQLANDSKGAIDVFTQMRENPNMRLLGLKGLYHEALKSKAIDVAHQYAGEAAKINPSLQWANRATVEQLSLAGDWTQALSLFSTYEKAAKKNKTAANEIQDLQHMRVIMMAGQAQEGFESYPDEAKRNALKAVKLEPNFIPAVNIAADILFKLHEVRKGSKIIEKLWSKSPHPDLALTYVNAYQGASALERFKRAQNLARFNPQDHASLMIVARTALEAGEYDLARQNALKIAQEAPTKNTYLLLSDIEAEQTGNEGKKREWLQLAINAEPDSVWIVDGVIIPQWVAISPISGQIGTCAWAQPEKNIPRNKLNLDHEHNILHLEALTAEVETKEVENVQPKTIQTTPLKDFVEAQKPATVAMASDKLEPIIEFKNDGQEVPTAIIIDAEPLDGQYSSDKIQLHVNRLNVDDPGIDASNNNDENMQFK